MICNAPLLYAAVMVEVLYAVPLNFSAMLLVAAGLLSELFLQELSAKANSARTKNVHFNDFIT